MAKVFVLECRDVGVPDCEFSTRGSNVEEVIEHCADHGRTEHGMHSFSPEMFAKMRSCLKQIDEEPAR